MSGSRKRAVAIVNHDVGPSVPAETASPWESPTVEDRRASEPLAPASTSLDAFRLYLAGARSGFV